MFVKRSNKIVKFTAFPVKLNASVANYKSVFPRGNLKTFVYVAA